MTDVIKSWGEVFFEGYIGSFPADVQHLLPAWSEMDDAVQLACEEKARELAAPVFVKHFGDHPVAEAAVFDVGQGNVDRAVEEIHLHHPRFT